MIRWYSACSTVIMCMYDKQKMCSWVLGRTLFVFIERVLRSVWHNQTTTMVRRRFLTACLVFSVAVFASFGVSFATTSSGSHLGKSIALYRLWRTYDAFSDGGLVTENMSLVQRRYVSFPPQCYCLCVFIFTFVKPINTTLSLLSVWFVNKKWLIEVAQVDNLISLPLPHSQLSPFMGINNRKHVPSFKGVDFTTL